MICEVTWYIGPSQACDARASDVVGVVVGEHARVREGQLLGGVPDAVVGAGLAEVVSRRAARGALLGDDLVEHGGGGIEDGMVVVGVLHHDHTGSVGERVLDLGEHRAAPVRREGAQVVAAVDDDLLDDVSGIRVVGGIGGGFDGGFERLERAVGLADPAGCGRHRGRVVGRNGHDSKCCRDRSDIQRQKSIKKPSFGVEHQTGPVGLGQA